MLILVGGSASGKSTIEKLLCENYGYKKVTSYTTRSPREGEVDGIHYHFITKKEFAEKQNKGFFAEVGCYNGWLYGSAVEDCTNDKVAVLTPHGMRQIKQMPEIDAICFYIKVDRRDRLIKILQRNDKIEEAKRRDSSDVGQFDGIEDEVTDIIENDSYKYSPEEMAKCVDFLYKEYMKTKCEKRLTILCDIDEVINNLVSRLIRVYNRKYEDNLTIDEMVDYDLRKFVKPECEDIFDEFCTDDLIADLEIQPKAKEVIEELSKRHNIYFLTSTFPKNIYIKDKWLKKMIPGYDSTHLIMCVNKFMVHGDILIDDYLENFARKRFIGEPVKYNLIFDKPWNRDFEEDNKKNFRVNNWEDIYEFVKKLEEHD